MIKVAYAITSSDVGSANGTYTNAVANKNIVQSLVESMRENVDISELVSVSVARDLDITGDDATYMQ